MAILKPISGHTSTRGIYRYLTKKNRALACDYVNLENPDIERPHSVFDWSRAMDETRRLYGNDRPWRGMRVRTYKHYVVSPDPRDGIGLESLRKLATAWAHKHFPDYEVAIVYHDDNEHGIPHAHVVVNNTNLETGKRLQDPDPHALNASLQREAAALGLAAFAEKDSACESGPSKGAPRTYRSEYLRRAERELVERGEYSWTADIRARVCIARAIARTEADFRGALGTMGVTMSENSPRAERRDWVYALASHPTRRISGERLGLSYGRERLSSVFSARSGEGGALVAGRVAEIARRAVAVGDIQGLRLLSRTVAFVEQARVRSLRELDAAAKTNGSANIALIASCARAYGILPETAPAVQTRVPASKRGVEMRKAGSERRGINGTVRQLPDLQRGQSRERGDGGRGR